MLFIKLEPNKIIYYLVYYFHFYVVVCSCIERRSVKSAKRPREMNEGADIKAKVFEELKLNAAKRSDCNRSPTDLNFNSYTKATTTSASENNLQDNRCKKTEYYAIFGTELANLIFELTCHITQMFF
jgi:hypothetical protein